MTNATIATLLLGTLASACSTAAATDKEQTGGRPQSTAGRSDAPRHPSWIHSGERGGRRPLPTIVLETTDMTSAIGSDPIVIRVNNFGSPVGQELLNALGREIHLYSDDLSREIAVKATIRDATRASVPGRYRQIESASVEIQPSAPLPDGWYVLKVLSIPAGLSLPRFGNRQTLPDGSLGARISPGSHPRPAAVRVCTKDNFVTLVSIDWSEPVVLGGDISSRATVRELSGASPAGDCVPESAQGSGSMRSTRFLCQNVPVLGGRFSIGLDRAIVGSGGGGLDIAGDRRTGKTNMEVALDSIEADGRGCKILKPW